MIIKPLIINILKYLAQLTFIYVFLMIIKTIEKR